MLTIINRGHRGPLRPVYCVKDYFIMAHSSSSELETKFNTRLNYASHIRKRDVAEVLRPPLTIRLCILRTLLDRDPFFLHENVQLLRYPSALIPNILVERTIYESRRSKVRPQMAVS